MHRWMPPAFLVLCMTATAVDLPAQEAPPAAAELGHTIRATMKPPRTVWVAAPDRRVVGVFVARVGQTLFIERDPDTLQIQIANLERLEVRGCCGGPVPGFLKGAGVGAAATLLGGLVLTAAPSDPHGGANLAMAGALLVLPAGILIGGLVGMAVWPAGDTWFRVPIP